MKEIVTCHEMKEIESHIIRQYQVPSLVLMERAALSVTTVIAERFHRKTDSILVLCGSGNNGGDGFAIARILFQEGWKIQICFLGKEDHMTSECRLQYEICHNFNVPMVPFPEKLSCSLIVDALFGIGLTREITGDLRSVIQKVNSCPACKLAVDLPSGVHGDTGEIMGNAIACDVTVTFGFYKSGMCLYPGRSLCGEILLREIGILDLMLVGRIKALEDKDLNVLPARNPAGNKGTFGKVLIVGGSPGMAGSVYLSGLSAFSTGVGMVRIQTAETNRLALQMLLPEAIIETDFSEETNRHLLDWCDVLVLGPGLGQSKEAEACFLWYLKEAKSADRQLILDADGLNLLASNPSARSFLGSHVVCTPHLGEFSRLVGKPISEIKRNLRKETLSFAEETGCVLVCKDAVTLIRDHIHSEEHVFLNLSGTSGMAVAGSGDCLTGILAGIACMFRSPLTSYEAALGVYLHGKAGELASEEKGSHGALSGDIGRKVSQVLKQIPFSS